MKGQPTTLLEPGLPNAMNHKEERQKDVDAVVNSNHDRRVVVAGPGTGKSFLFEQVLKKAKKEGKKNFLAITFIGKLGDALADDLAGLADTMTLHGFARQFVLKKWPKAEYYPRILDVIRDDLATIDADCTIDSKEYRARTEHYKAVGDDDVVFYALQICKKDANKIPVRDLILIDEFQDFNEIESEFIDILTTKNKILIVGDDDQALYEFKGSSPKFIRDKHDVINDDYESHTLRFCSRCTEPIIGAFHNIVNHYGLNSGRSKRIKKDYMCYLPDKQVDNQANPKMILSENTEIAHIPFLIKDELTKILGFQKIKSVLIIGEAQSCAAQLATIAKKMRSFGFKNVDHRGTESRMFAFKQSVIDAYKFISKDGASRLGWRLLADLLPEADRSKLIKDDCSGTNELYTALPEAFKSVHKKNAAVLKKIVEGTPSVVKSIADSSINKLMVEVVEKERAVRELFTHQLAEESQMLPRPLGNLDITICSILGSKGLGADVVFVVGFDEGKIPAKKQVEDSEIYQMLVALTRAKKRIYLVNTVNCQVSQFIKCIDAAFYETL